MDTVPPGRPVGRAWLRLFRLIPFDRLVDAFFKHRQRRLGTYFAGG